MDQGLLSTLKVKYKENGLVRATLRYKSWLERMSLEERENMFTTEDMEGSLNGFIEVEPGLYLKLIIRNSPFKKPSQQHKEPLNVSIKDKRITWTMDIHSEFAVETNEDIVIKKASHFVSDELDGLYFKFVLTNNRKLSGAEHLKKRKTLKQKMMKDFRDSDAYQYGVSPNLDGSRSRKEYLAGTGSNIKRTRY